MNAPNKRSSLLCPNCRRLVSRNADQCPTCGLKRPGSKLYDNVLTRLQTDSASFLKAIIIVNIAMFIVSLAIDLRPSSFSGHPFGFLSPSNNSLLVLGSTGTIPIFQLHSWWTLVSASYLHGSLLHIVFNMIALHQLGPLIIREYGPSRMFIIYSLSGIGGYLVSSLLGVRFTIGASAAVCGLIGAALYYGKSRGGHYGQAVFSQIGGWAIGIILFGIMVPEINNFGHAGGMVAGVLTAYALGYQDRRKEGIGHKLFSAVCIVGTGLVLLLSLARGGLFLFLSS